MLWPIKTKQKLLQINDGSLKISHELDCLLLKSNEPFRFIDRNFYSEQREIGLGDVDN